ncbi:hypothetical protein [Bacillus sp. T33-2]|uniref:hypothetical protein n=1 Tax=Bacillus sp. T33-2 TaxID=2054168 RepID=UPI000C77E682|nr:hypothetical protein [Bacillus sp. T33-2]PLR94481.1 hypothetical protein CVD19_17495 [Bacillus sp. T33-2]
MSKNAGDAEGLEKLLVSLIKMVGKTNEKVDELMKRVHQLETAVKEPQTRRIYSFIAEPEKVDHFPQNNVSNQI